MSNGWTGCGWATAEFGQHDLPEGVHKGEVTVLSCWSSSANWVELICRPNDDREDSFTIYLDRGNDDAVELTMALLEAVDEKETADALGERTAALAEKNAGRRRAEDESWAAREAAAAEFHKATVAQRAAFDAAMDQVDKAYKETTGERMRQSRSVDWHDAPIF